MTVIVEIINEYGYAVPELRWQTAVETILDRHKITADVEMSIAVQDDDAMILLNQQFRDKDSPTDVLSFPSGEVDDLQALPESCYLGDLAIAFPYASTQAKRYKQPLEDNLTLLVVHGVLHLLGYDHDNNELRAQMWQEQASVLQALGIATTIVPVLEGEPHD